RSRQHDSARATQAGDASEGYLRAVSQACREPGGLPCPLRLAPHAPASETGLVLSRRVNPAVDFPQQLVLGAQQVSPNLARSLLVQPNQFLEFVARTPQRDRGAQQQ